MDTDEFRDYILGFVFYKYLSEKIYLYANGVLNQDGIAYDQFDEKTTEYFLGKNLDEYEADEGRAILE